MTHRPNRPYYSLNNEQLRTSVEVIDGRLTKPRVTRGREPLRQPRLPFPPPFRPFLPSFLPFLRRFIADRYDGTVVTARNNSGKYRDPAKSSLRERTEAEKEKEEGRGSAMQSKEIEGILLGFGFEPRERGEEDGEEEEEEAAR